METGCPGASSSTAITHWTGMIVISHSALNQVFTSYTVSLSGCYPPSVHPFSTDNTPSCNNILPILIALTPTEPATQEQTEPETTFSPENEFSVCGKPWQGRIASRIFGGRKSKPGAHPWQVSLQVRHRNSTHPFVHDCGGIVLNSCWILTAAHCM